MELVTPGIGLIFWMTLSFGLLLFVLTKFAWRPIMSMLREREQSIEEALHEADKARDEMKQLQAHNIELLNQAKEERDAILKDARQIREKLIEEAREKAGREYDRLLESAQEAIKNEKMAAITELKNEIATLSIDIAERLMRERLTSAEKQDGLVQKLINEIKIN
ncbi:MAG TPA: ATP synthase F0 subunit B [Bacteroidales bacterium]|nr:MAG: ATP synthase F0 subunit B [Bacteroidetes bacterium GWE2_42_24]OFY27561.1 MAG: ATP synthase F0 subunit B [Bacteroidetes bacterium GWF2_43_11]HAQ64959.1 ATP synthase F0 subunit B [Bacteroidales bacterium]HBZ66085.1 ATP synthase F0 subunit B [Bacteroidales bacterium]